MNRTIRAGLGLLAAGLAIVAGPRPALALDNLFLLHHSVGRYMIDQGHVRQLVTDYNTLHGTHFMLWDHDYNAIGLSNPFGLKMGRSYNIPNDNTDPVGLHDLWTTANAARDSILANHQVIAFKSCYPASSITSDALLEQYKTWYLEIRTVLDQHPDKVFLVLSPPPEHPCYTTLANADRARAFADWLGSPAFLAGHPNLRYFDFFNALAGARDISERNTLRADYRNSSQCQYADSHPNTVGNLAVAPLLVAALLNAAAGNQTGVPGTGSVVSALFTAVSPNPFNPRTTIRFDLPAAGRVRLAIYDIAGHLLRTLIDSELPSGSQETTWDGRDTGGGAMSSGNYFARIETAGRRETTRMTLIR